NTFAGRGMGLLPDPAEARAASDEPAPDSGRKRKRRAKGDKGEVEQEHLPPIWDQDNLGSCTQFASQRCVQFSRSTQGFDTMEPSFLFGYWYTRYDEGGPAATNEDTGASISAAVDATRKHGTAPAELWPYDIRRFREKPPEAAAAAALGKQTVVRVPVREGDIEGLVAALCEKRPDGGVGYPIAIGIPVFEGAFGAIDDKGRIPDPKPDDTIAGYHAIAIVAYDNSIQIPDFGLDNSWGPSFGDHGRFRLSQAFIKKYAFDFWIIKNVEADQAA
ncbi:MAG TPA: C1 family peptidase, partial [Thermomicrobiales bacterium]|nr:C1 family peptidase [Thermomicrobiales bacterium]